MIIKIVELYGFFGVVFMLVYMYDVGQLISKKYGCGLMEGIARFERAGDTMSNIRAVIYGILSWPKLLMAMRNGKWWTTLKEMVDEYDYDD